MDKLRFFIAAVLMMVFFAQAAGQEGVILENADSPELDFQILDSINEFLYWEIETAWDLTAFLLLTGALYAPLKFMTGNVFKLIAENFPTSGYSRGESQPGARLFALTTAAISAQFLGFYLTGGLLLFITVVSLILIAYLFVTGVGESAGETPGILQSIAHHGNTAIAGLSDVGGMLTDIARRQQGGEDIDDVRRDEQEEEQANEEIQDIEDELKYMFEDLEEEVQDLMRRLQEEDRKAEQAYNELTALEEAFEGLDEFMKTWEENFRGQLAESISDEMGEIGDHMDAFSFMTQDGSLRSQQGTNFARRDALPWDEFFTELNGKLNQIEGAAGKFENDEHEVVRETVRILEEIEEVVKLIEQYHEALVQLHEEIQMLEEEEMRTEEIAEELGDMKKAKLAERLIQKTNEEEKVENKLEEHQNYLVQQLEEIEGVLSDIENIHRHDFSELDHLAKIETETINWLKNLERAIDNKAEFKSNVSNWDGELEKLDEAIKLIRALEQADERLEEEEKQLDTRVEKTINKVNEVIKTITEN